MITVQNEDLWIEKYRPQKVEDCIISAKLKKEIKDMVKKGEIPNLLFYGTAGTGKTTLAHAIARELGSDVLFINASLENGIDVLRTKIAQFASTVSLSGGVKIIILDEADYTNPQSFQPALRGFIEEFSQNCRFIFTCNFKNRLIAPLHSRCTGIDFKIPKSEKPALAQAFFKRVCSILDNEKVSYNEKVVAKMVGKHFPDFRRVLNELQRYSASGTIDEGILSNVGEANIAELFTAMKEKDWKAMRAWVANQEDQEVSSIYTMLFEECTARCGDTVPNAVLIIADYAYKSAFVVDQGINLTACLTELMASVSFKD